MDLQLFKTQDGRSLAWEVFLASELGQLYQTIPFQALSAAYQSELPSPKSAAGVKGRFDIAGGIGLQILKHYYGLSDAKLIELLNGNWQLQYFCGLHLKLGEQLKDSGVVSRWRKRLGLAIEQLSGLISIQKILVGAWQGLLRQTQSNLSDATCYESYVRYPTDAKLLWESVDWLWHQLRQISRCLGIKMLRSKYRAIAKAYLSYQKMRRKSHKKTRQIRRRLIRLLQKLLKATPSLIAAWKSQEQGLKATKSPVKSNFYERLSIIKKVAQQQQFHLDYPDRSIPNRIVSLHKAYLRPIVRGKENKRVEFGAKAHVMQVSGLNFLEYISFNAFHEGKRLKKTIWQHRNYFGKCQHFGGDAIYATNANRKYCTQQGIQTCFKPKGRKGKNEKHKRQLRQIIGKERATRLEGSFGNEKNHYLLRKVKARTKVTELAWIFWGMMTANAVAIRKRKKQLSPP